MALKSLERFVGNVVLDLTGIFCGSILIYAKTDKKVSQEFVAVVHLHRYLATELGEGNVSVFVYVYISARLQKAYRAADTRLREAHVLAHVY